MSRQGYCGIGWRVQDVKPTGIKPVKRSSGAASWALYISATGLLIAVESSGARTLSTTSSSIAQPAGRVTESTPASSESEGSGRDAIAVDSISGDVAVASSSRDGLDVRTRPYIDAFRTSLNQTSEIDVEKGIEHLDAALASVLALSRLEPELAILPELRTELIDASLNMATKGYEANRHDVVVEVASKGLEIDPAHPRLLQLLNASGKRLRQKPALPLVTPAKSLEDKSGE